ncbi:MAG: hypothetical protein A2Y38_16750 [Spirochaetes bacterium GWB1_59_5]|nr:MAG: hypothetical protein A2Y38_16750 [Spirochaetes bacterium GWB1_59_5]
MNNLAEEYYPEILLDLRDKIAELIGDQGAAFAITEYIRRERGGRNLYLPKGRKRKPAEPEPGGQEALFAPAVGAPLVAPDSDAVPGWIDRLRQAAEKILVERGLAAELAPAVAELVRAELTGEGVYIPQGQRYAQALRDADILDRFSRANIDRLCSQHGLTEQRVYQILNKELRKRQRRLFD